MVRPCGRRSDQRGADAFANRRSFAVAASLFESPGLARRRQLSRGELRFAAIAAYSALDTPDGHYNRGNALALSGNYAEAIAAYELTLAVDSGTRRRDLQQGNRGTIAGTTAIGTRRKHRKANNRKRAVRPEFGSTVRAGPGTTASSRTRKARRAMRISSRISNRTKRRKTRKTPNPTVNRTRQARTATRNSRSSSRLSNGCAGSRTTPANCWSASSAINTGSGN